jgi:hypothetical protein
MSLICTIFVMFKVGSMEFFTKDEVSGTMISQTETMVVGDFSKDAADRGLLGPYGKVLVKKQDCRGFAK